MIISMTSGSQTFESRTRIKLSPHDVCHSVACYITSKAQYVLPCQGFLASKISMFSCLHQAKLFIMQANAMLPYTIVCFKSCHQNSQSAESDKISLREHCSTRISLRAKHIFFIKNPAKITIVGCQVSMDRA